MMRLRPANERGHAHHGWLDTFHTFSFNTYYDSQHMGFRTLRVINDDTIAPGRGFGTHGHRDMEILSYILDGALEHKDSIGTGSVLRAGDVQRMSAGTGVTHSEFNHSPSEPLRLLQIWIFPEKEGLAPGYEERHFPVDEKRGRLRLIASPEGADRSLRVHQDVRVYASILAEGRTVGHSLAPGRHAWIQIADGRVSVNGRTLGRGDGAALSQETRILLRGERDETEAELLLFDLS